MIEKHLLSTSLFDKAMQEETLELPEDTAVLDAEDSGPVITSLLEVKHLNA